jgi:hypothetical protein
MLESVKRMVGYIFVCCTVGAQTFHPLNIETYLLSQHSVSITVSWENQYSDYSVETSNFDNPIEWREFLTTSDPFFSITPGNGIAFFRVKSVARKVADFGCDLLPNGDCAAIVPRDACGPAVQSWPLSHSSVEDSIPFKFDWWAGPYQNKAGYDAVNRINEQFRTGQSAGLMADRFRSFDNNHSTVRAFYPQLTILDATGSYLNSCEMILEQKVSLGVQSFRVDGSPVGDRIAVMDYYDRVSLAKHYRPDMADSFVVDVIPDRDYRILFEKNALIISPSVDSFKTDDTGDLDRFTFLKPYSMHATGASGVDSDLAKIILFASASLAPPTKERIFRNGLFVPVMEYLIRRNLHGDLLDPKAHAPSINIPAEAYLAPPQQKTLENGQLESRLSAYENAPSMSAPFLDSLLEDAAQLTSIPPITRMLIQDDLIHHIKGSDQYEKPPYISSSPYAISIALRPGEWFEGELDLAASWTDQEAPMMDSQFLLIRDLEGRSTVESLGNHKFRISIPWSQGTAQDNLRTDLAFFAEDSQHIGFPAYLSVRHIQPNDVFNFLGTTPRAKE